MNDTRQREWTWAQGESGHAVVGIPVQHVINVADLECDPTPTRFVAEAVSLVKKLAQFCHDEQIAHDEAERERIADEQQNAENGRLVREWVELQITQLIEDRERSKVEFRVSSEGKLNDANQYDVFVNGHRAGILWREHFQGTSGGYYWEFEVEPPADWTEEGQEDLASDLYSLSLGLVVHGECEHPYLEARRGMSWETAREAKCALKSLLREPTRKYWRKPHGGYEEITDA
jgi:hypothetical protein